ncbi:hypothetical protein ALT_7513 [Aspergillus lentulus]|uniref:Ketoreductase domain-containing protein n=1 Tax=Aspergillus lentulus TaxID=293939 RepID=A0AAN4PPD3_ASPLE|nr:hypothetical protein ALT_7513 [Aspergillus lentulus]
MGSALIASYELPNSRTNGTKLAHEPTNGIAKAIDKAATLTGRKVLFAATTAVGERPGWITHSVAFFQRGSGQHLAVPGRGLRGLEFRYQLNISPTDYHRGSCHPSMPWNLYFMVGMAGELSRSLCRVMVNCGARHIALASRNPVSDASWLADIWVAGAEPKVDGTIHLNEHSSNYNVDFFITFSSLESVYGNAGQFIYHAANMFVTSLVNKRRRRGQAGSVINIGMWTWDMSPRAGTNIENIILAILHAPRRDRVPPSLSPSSAVRSSRLSQCRLGHSLKVFVGVLVSFILSSLFVAARLVSRFGIVRRHGWDDYTIIVAWFLAFGMSFAVAFCTFKGLGLPEENISPAWVDPLLKARYAAIVLYNPALNVTKASILFLYIDIAQRAQRFLYFGSCVTFAVVLAGGVAFTFLTALQCRPIKAAYNLTIKNPTCVPIETIDLAIVPVNVATGLAILVLPIPVLTKLHLPLGQKTILLLLFILGVILIIVADVVRTYNLQLAAINLRQSTTRPPVNLKFLESASSTALWSTVEVNVAIVGACIPTLLPLIKRLIPKLIRSPRSSNRQMLPSPSSLPDRAEAGSSSPNEPHRHQSSSISLQADYQEQLQPQICTTSEEAQSPYQRSDVSTFSRTVGFERSRCMLDMRGSESVKYCVLVAFLLFLEGFIIVLLSSVNSNMPVVENETQAIGVTSATYAGGAFIVPFIGYWLLRHAGFKATFVVALAIICTGNLIFWPSGALGSYPGFIVANVVVGTAATLLDMSTIAFLTLCGPTQYAEIRVLMGLGVGYSGSAISFLLSEKIFFAHVANYDGVIAIQWTYLAVALSMVLLGLFYYYLPLPEATVMDLQSRDNRLWIDPSQRFFGKLPVYITTLALGLRGMGSWTVFGASVLEGGGNLGPTIYPWIISPVCSTGLLSGGHSAHP